MNRLEYYTKLRNYEKQQELNHSCYYENLGKMKHKILTIMKRDFKKNIPDDASDEEIEKAWKKFKDDNYSSYYEEYKENKIQHYGIIGQKWGTRRWQNSDGTFNEEGKIRYFGKESKEEKQEKKEQYKNLKQQAKESGIELGFRGDVAKWCMKHGIDKIDDKIVDGFDVGSKFVRNETKIEYAQDWIEKIKAESKEYNDIKNDKWSQDFKKNNEYYKQYKKELENVQKDLEQCSKEFTEELKKYSDDKDIKAVIRITNGGTSCNYYIVNNKNNILIKPKDVNIPDNISLDGFVTYVKSSKIFTKEFQENLHNARKSLSKTESECQNFAKDYLAYWGDLDCSNNMRLKFDMKTNKMERMKNYEYYGYLMTSDNWEEVGGP